MSKNKSAVIATVPAVVDPISLVQQISVMLPRTQVMIRLNYYSGVTLLLKTVANQLDQEVPLGVSA